MEYKQFNPEFPYRRTYINDSGKEYAILRLNDSFIELSTELIAKAETELILKVVLGIDYITAAERVAYYLLSSSY